MQCALILTSSNTGYKYCHVLLLSNRKNKEFLLLTCRNHIMEMTNSIAFETCVEVESSPGNALFNSFFRILLYC